MREHLCWKCRDGRTWAHHRLCSKRGGKVERWNSAWRSEAEATRTGQASPGRLRGTTATQAQVYGLWWRHYDEQAEKARREMSPLTASPDGLRKLAALYDVA